MSFGRQLPTLPAPNRPEETDKMTAAIWHDVSALTERESVFWYLQATVKSVTRNLVMILALPFLLPLVLFFAQVIPFRLLKATKKLNNVLPNVSDKDELTLVRDILALYSSAARFYGWFCLFPWKMAEAREELCDTIDSIEFVLKNYEELKEFVVRSEEKRSPSLPLSFERATG